MRGRPCLPLFHTFTSSKSLVPHLPLQQELHIDMQRLGLDEGFYRMDSNKDTPLHKGEVSEEVQLDFRIRRTTGMPFGTNVHTYPQILQISTQFPITHTRTHHMVVFTPHLVVIHTTAVEIPINESGIKGPRLPEV